MKKILFWLKGDKDITYYEEFHYIYITLKELIKILKQKYIDYKTR